MKKRRISNRVFVIIFIISQFYWLCWIGVGIHNFTNGINTGWLLTALANPENVVYGMDSVGITIEMIFFASIMTPLVIIPIYQATFLVAILIKKIREKSIK